MSFVCVSLVYRSNVGIVVIIVGVFVRTLSVPIYVL